MGLNPSFSLKKALSRISRYLKQSIFNKNSAEWKSTMDAAELETSGLQEKQILNSRISGLPDGTKPVPLGTGVITGILGEGGSSILYEIHNAQFSIKRAVKLLRPNHTKESLTYFLREFRISAQLSHPNIVTVHNAGVWHGLPFIEMEKVTGFSVTEMYSQFGPLPLGLCTSIGIILCKVLSYIHLCKFMIDEKEFRGLLHLDFKPSNIMLSEKGMLKLMDFGLGTPVQEARSGMHGGGQGVGSPQYAAPEFLFGKGSIDVRADLFSLGCILYEISSGTRTFNGSKSESILDIRKTNDHENLGKANKLLPKKFVVIVEKCLSFEKEGRPFDATTVQKELESIHSRITSMTPEDIIQMYVNQRKANEPFQIPRPVKNHSLMVIYSSALVIAVCAGLLFFLFLWKPDKLSLMGTTLYGRLITHSLSVHHDPSNLKQVVSTTKESIPSTSSEDQNSTVAPNKSEQVENEFYAPSLNSSQSAILDSLRKTWALRHFDEMLSIINGLPPELSQTKEVTLYKLRALGRGGEELGKILSQQEIQDGEYFFHKARFLAGNKDYQGALESLTKAESLPCEFLDKRILGREVRLYRARCLTGQFRASPSSENLKAALTAWDSLLESVQNNPNSIQGKEAGKEKQNLVAEAQWRGIK